MTGSVLACRQWALSSELPLLVLLEDSGVKDVYVADTMSKNEVFY